jgi:hypothetical protein
VGVIVPTWAQSFVPLTLIVTITDADRNVAQTATTLVLKRKQ